MMEFGEIRPVEIRSVWPNEAHDFTPWLAKNIDQLGKSLGMEIVVVEQEASVGEFSLDILATETGTGRTVIVENQLTSTDHDHLGKLLTYAGGFDAAVLVWIATEIRDEHRKALEWLNDHTGADIHCFGVVIEVLRIDSSRPAFNFKPIVFPNEWQKQHRPRQGNSPREEAYRQYFQALIDDLRTKHKFTNAKVGQPQGWYSFSSGLRGTYFSNSFAQGGKIRAELYIDLGDWDANKQLFDRLCAERPAIEREFGETLSWERLDDRRASRIAIYREGTIDSSTEVLETLRNWSIDKLLKLKVVTLSRIRAHLQNSGE